MSVARRAGSGAAISRLPNCSGRPYQHQQTCACGSSSRRSGLPPSGWGSEDLSPREFEILRMILEARTTDEIASAFHVSRKTVANYHYNIKSKLGVSSD